jgi:hypothetical protein
MDELDKTPARPLALWLGTVAPGGHHRSITVIWWFSHQLGLVHPRLPPFAPSTREWSFERSIACDGLPLTAIHPSLPRGRRAGCRAPFASGWGGTGAAKSILLVAATSRLGIPALWRPLPRRKGVARERNSHQRCLKKRRISLVVSASFIGPQHVPLQLAQAVVGWRVVGCAW